MDNISEALKFVVAQNNKIHDRKILEVLGRTYSFGNLQPVKEPVPETIKTTTLTGLVDFVSSDFGPHHDTNFIHVKSPESVAVLSDLFGSFVQRKNPVCAEHVGMGFKFGIHLPPADFLVGLHALFAEGGDKDDLLRGVSAIKIDAGGTVEDNGISQKVTVTSGARLLEVKDLKPRVTLYPHCTFPEIAPPMRQFVFRLDKEGKPGLFPADGETWKGRTMAEIKTWLSERLPQWKILA